MKRLTPHIFTSNKRVSLWVVVPVFCILAMLFYRVAKLNILLNPMARYIQSETKHGDISAEADFMGKFFAQGETRQSVLKKLQKHGYYEASYFKSIASAQSYSQLPIRKKKTKAEKEEATAFVKPLSFDFTISDFSKSSLKSFNEDRISKAENDYVVKRFASGSVFGFGYNQQRLLSFKKVITRIPKCEYQIINLAFDQDGGLMKSAGATIRPIRYDPCMYLGKGI